MANTLTELHFMTLHIFESEAARAEAEAQGLIGENDLVITPETGNVDTELSDTSTNPVENRAIKKYVDDAIAAALTQLTSG